MSGSGCKRPGNGRDRLFYADKTIEQIQNECNSKVFGTHSERELKRIPIVDKIEALRPSMMELSTNS